MVGDLSCDQMLQSLRFSYSRRVSPLNLLIKLGGFFAICKTLVLGRTKFNINLKVKQSNLKQIKNG